MLTHTRYKKHTLALAIDPAAGQLTATISPSLAQSALALGRARSGGLRRAGQSAAPLGATNFSASSFYDYGSGGFAIFAVFEAFSAEMTNITKSSAIQKIPAATDNHTAKENNKKISFLNFKHEAVR